MWIILAIVGGLLLLGVVIGIVSARNTVVGDCPACGKKVGVGKFGTCDHCGEPLRSSDGKIEAVPAGFVADATVFSTSLATLRHPTKWEPVWAGRCCVCGGPATTTKKLKVKSVEGHVGPMLAPQNIMHAEKIELGYCAGHSDGVHYMNAPHFANSIDNSKCWVYFRSADFYREFMKVNGLGRVPAKVGAAAGGPPDKWPCGHDKAPGTTRCWDCER